MSTIESKKHELKPQNPLRARANMKHALAALGATGLAVAATAWADSGINVQTLTPGSGSSYVFTENGAPELPPDVASDQSYRRYHLGVNYDYLDSPLVQTDTSGNTRLSTLVSGIQTFDMQAGIEWSGRFSLNVSMPLDLVDTPSVQGEATAGDLRFFPKLYLLNRDAPIQLAVMPEVWFPTGDPSLFTSNGGGYGIILAAEHDFGLLSVAANVGYRSFPNALFQDIDYRQTMPLALGLNIPLTGHLGANVEGSSSILIPMTSSQNPSDLYGGLNWKANDMFTITGGGGVDTFNSAASGNYRIVVGLRLTPVATDAAPVPAVSTPPVAKAPEPAPAPAVVPPPPPAPLVSTRVVYTPKWIYVRDEILFENNSARLLKPSKRLLDEVAQVLKTNRKDYKSIVIEGHGNELGSDATNLALSQRRADAVKAYLVSKGIARKTLKTIGYGKRKPKVGKNSGVSRETRLVLDRRVQFRVIH